MPGPIRPALATCRDSRPRPSPRVPPLTLPRPARAVARVAARPCCCRPRSPPPAPPPPRAPARDCDTAQCRCRRAPPRGATPSAPAPDWRPRRCAPRARPPRRAGARRDRRDPGRRARAAGGPRDRATPRRRARLPGAARRPARRPPAPRACRHRGPAPAPRAAPPAPGRPPRGAPPAPPAPRAGPPRRRRRDDPPRRRAPPSAGAHAMASRWPTCDAAPAPRRQNLIAPEAHPQRVMLRDQIVAHPTRRMTGQSWATARWICRRSFEQRPIGMSRIRACLNQ